LGCRSGSILGCHFYSRWDKDGDLYSAYDLHLDGEAGEQAVLPDEETVGKQDIIFDDDSETSNKKPGVKVLSEKSHSEILKMVDGFRKNEQANGHSDAVKINLSNEFAEILSPGRYGMVN